MSLTAFIGRCPHCGHDHGENILFDVARGELTPAQQEQLNEQFANYAKQKPHLYGGCDEITTLREQLAALTKERDELKTVPMKYRRMQFNAELQDEVTQLQKQLAALAEQNEKQRAFLEFAWKDIPMNEYAFKILEHTMNLPNLSSPVLNRIRAEAYREAAMHCSKHGSRTADEVSEDLFANADELEQSK